MRLERDISDRLGANTFATEELVVELAAAHFGVECRRRPLLPAPHHS